MDFIEIYMTVVVVFNIIKAPFQEYNYEISRILSPVFVFLLWLPIVGRVFGGW